MRFQFFKRMSQDDYRDADEWFEPVFDAFNPMVDYLNRVLPNGLTLTDNIRCEIKTITVQHGVAANIRLDKLTGTRPRFVRTGYASGHVVTGCQIVGYVNNNTVQVKVLFDGAPAGDIQLVVCFEP